MDFYLVTFLKTRSQIFFCIHGMSLPSHIFELSHFTVLLLGWHWALDFIVRGHRHFLHCHLPWASCQSQLLPKNPGDCILVQLLKIPSCRSQIPPHRTTHPSIPGRGGKAKQGLSQTNWKVWGKCPETRNREGGLWRGWRWGLDN